MSFKMKKYNREDLEWCAGRMVHLRVKGEYRTICGADPHTSPTWDHFLAPGGYGHRKTLTDAEAAQEHQCKNCLKRVRPSEEWICGDGDIFPSREAAIDHLRLVGNPGETGKLARLERDHSPHWLPTEWEEMEL